MLQDKFRLVPVTKASVAMAIPGSMQMLSEMHILQDYKTKLTFSLSLSKAAPTLRVAPMKIMPTLSVTPTILCVLPTKWTGD